MSRQLRPGRERLLRGGPELQLRRAPERLRRHRHLCVRIDALRPEPRLLGGGKRRDRLHAAGAVTGACRTDNARYVEVARLSSDGDVAQGCGPFFVAQRR